MGRVSDLRGSGRQRQRGAAAVFAAVSIIMGLVCVGLAVDLGRFYFLKRDLQRMANIAALDAARVAGGCLGAIANPLAEATAEVLASVTRNGGDPLWAAGGVTVGRLDGREAVRFFDPVLDQKNRAVRVTLTRPMPSRLIPIFDTGGGAQTMSASSSAFDSPSATVKMGTQVVNVDPARQTNLNRLFTSLLGGAVSLDVLTYQALFDADVPTAGILDRLGLSTPDELEVNPVSQRELLDALVAELNAQGSTTAAAAAQALSNVASTTTMVLPGQVLGVNDPVSPAVLTAANIAMAVSQAGAAGTLVNVPVGLAAPLNGTLELLLTQPGLPTFLVPGGVQLFAENFASNTQALARTTVPFTVPLVLPLGLGNLSVSSNLRLFVQAGKGTAEVEYLSCAKRGQDEDLAYVRAQTSILNVGIGQFTDINAPNPVAERVNVVDVTVNINVGLFNVPIRIVVSALASFPIASSNTVLEQPFSENETQHMGTPRVTGIIGNYNASSVDIVRVDTLQVVGSFPLITGTLNTVIGVLGPAIDLALTNQIVSLLGTLADSSVLPLLDTAGITVGGADVTVTDIDAAQPYLFTH